MKRIFMLSSHSLFSQGIEIVLSQKCDVEIVGHEADVDIAIARIRELRPDVVIVDNGLAASTDGTLVMRILQEQTGAKIVGLSLHDNSFSIYRGEQRELGRIEDLTRAIENDDMAFVRKENGEASNQSKTSGAIQSIQSVREDKDEQ
jgi:chemotaxis response regulator CheB